MKIDVRYVLTDLEDKPMSLSKTVDPQTKAVINEKFLSVAHAATEALLTPQRGEEGMGAEEKLERFNIALRIANAQKADGILDLSMEELVKIKALVGKGWSALVVGRFSQAVDLAGPAHVTEGRA